MAYIPDATNVAEPAPGSVKAATAAIEFQAIKLYMRDVLLAGLNLKAPINSPTFTGNVGVGATATTRLHVQGSGDVLRVANGTRDAYLAMDSGGFSLLTGAGQTGNGMYASAADNSLRLWSASTERIRVDASGNVGVGTNNPTSKLAVSGDIRALSGGQFILNNADNSSAATVVYNASNALVVSHNGGVERMRIDASGNVGIGTASTGAKLYVSGNATSGYGYVTDGSGVLLFGGSSPLTGGLLTGGAAIRTESYLAFCGAGGIERMRIDGSGNVGIGATPSSICKLSVAGGFSVGGPLGSASAYGAGYFSAENSGATFRAYVGDGTGYTWNFSKRASSVTTDLMTITDAGNVGIGTTGPLAKLDVRGQQMVGTDNYTGRINFGTGSQWYLSAAGTTTANATFSINGWNGSSYSQMVTLDSSGALLLGATSSFTIGGASAQQYVTSTTGTSFAANFRNTSATTALGIGVLYSAASPNNTGNEFIYCTDSTTIRFAARSNGGLANYSANNANLSDARLKTDVQPAPSYYSRWKDIDFCTFLYKDQTDTERNLGVLAQQLEAVCPELIDNSGFGEAPAGEAPYKAIYQTDFQYATAVALQEAIREIEALRERIIALEAR